MRLIRLDRIDGIADRDEPARAGHPGRGRPEHDRPCGGELEQFAHEAALELDRWFIAQPVRKLVGGGTARTPDPQQNSPGECQQRHAIGHHGVELLEPDLRQSRLEQHRRSEPGQHRCTVRGE